MLIETNDMNHDTFTFATREVTITRYTDENGVNMVSGVGIKQTPTGGGIEVGHTSDSITRAFENAVDSRATMMFWIEQLLD